MIIEVTCSELQAAAKNISNQNQAFRDAVTRLMTATANLEAGWEGGVHDKFVTAMSERSAWCNKMADIVDGYVAMLGNAAEKYEDMDRQGAAAIRKN